MDTACVHQTKSFQNKTAWTQSQSENEMHAYWYNIDTNKVRHKCFWCKALEKPDENWNFPCGQWHCFSLISVATSWLSSACFLESL